MTTSFLSLDSASEQNFTARKANTTELSIDVLDPAEDQDYDFTGCSMKFTLRKHIDDFDYVFQLTSGAGITLTTGNILLAFTSTNMNQAEGMYFYDMQITLSTGAVHTWLVGKFEIHSRVS